MAKVTWHGQQVLAQIAQRAAEALTEIDQRIETEAKTELYPGHGKQSGTLQRAIRGDVGHVEGNVVKGKVGAKGVRYALRIHRKYEYITKALERVKPQALAILSKHVKRG